MKKPNALFSHCFAMLTSLLTMLVVSNSYAEQQPLSFKKAIQVAQQNDPWLEGSRHKEKSLIQLSDAANTQSDPKVSLAFANLPTNGFNFSQERMTQFKVGISQTFARGDSLSIKNQQLKLASQQQPLLRQDRLNSVTVTVGRLWLDLYRVQRSIMLIEENRSLFEQLTDVAEANYGSGLGKIRQQDIVRAQLELTRLEDKLNRLQQQSYKYQGMLGQWLPRFLISPQYNEIDQLASLTPSPISVSNDQPIIALINHANVYSEQGSPSDKLIAILSSHPSLKSIDKQIAVNRAGIELAEQQYHPQWGINASYGYRADDDTGKSRADLFSVGVVFDVPLFTENRQDNEVKAAISKTEAIKTEKLLLLRKLISNFAGAKGQLMRLTERQVLYREKLLPQIHDQAEASLTAYTNDDGDFAEVVRARIAELNAEIDFLEINVEKQKVTLEINYLLSGSLINQQVGEK